MRLYCCSYISNWCVFVHFPNTSVSVGSSSNDSYVSRQGYMYYYFTTFQNYFAYVWGFDWVEHSCGIHTILIHVCKVHSLRNFMKICIQCSVSSQYNVGFDTSRYTCTSYVLNDFLYLKRFMRFQQLDGMPFNIRLFRMTKVMTCVAPFCRSGVFSCMRPSNPPTRLHDMEDICTIHYILCIIFIP